MILKQYFQVKPNHQIVHILTNQIWFVNFISWFGDHSFPKYYISLVNSLHPLSIKEHRNVDVFNQHIGPVNFNNSFAWAFIPLDDWLPIDHYSK
jgi:hypothetical protein